MQRQYNRSRLFVVFLAGMSGVLHAVAQPGTINPTESGIVQIGDAPAAQARPALYESSEVFGHSVQGRPLVAHVLGDGDNVTMIFAAVHGNETATPYLVQQLRAHLKRHPGLLRDRRVILVPVMNPDGLQARARVNARGVDINRNYPGTWRLPKRGERFKSGAGPASEP
jgi:predicted deacylase